jgi:CheY-like chemotaxis protein
MSETPRQPEDPSGTLQDARYRPDDTAFATFEVSTHDVQVNGVPDDLLGHPRYLILGRVGCGAMGTVFRAVHLLMDRVVALKVVRPELVGRPGAAQRFRREVRAASKLAHPNVVTAFDADRAGGTHFLVMEFVEGLNLDDLLRLRGPLPVAEACGYARQAALGLQHAHEKGMVHRDVKPHNLMLTPQGQVKILDFGLARFVSEAGGDAPPAAVPGEGSTAPMGEQAGDAPGYGVVGTPDYLAPEQLDPQSADVRADVYGLGCTLYRFLAGRVPFPGGDALDKMKRHLRKAPTPLTELRPDLPERLGEVVARMMAKDPADRYQTPGEAAQALMPFVDGGLLVLVVDDDPATCAGLASALEAEGYAVAQAADGSEALQALRAGLRPGLILLDLAMPGMDGWAFLRERERDAELASIPVIVVSAADPAQARAAALGAAGQIQKPVTPAEVTACVRRRADRGGPQVVEARRLPELLRSICQLAGLTLPRRSDVTERFVVRCGADPPDFFARLLEEALAADGDEVTVLPSADAPGEDVPPPGRLAVQPGFSPPCPVGDELRRAASPGGGRTMDFAIERRGAAGQLLGVTWAAVPESESSPEAGLRAAVLRVDREDSGGAAGR